MTDKWEIVTQDAGPNLKRVGFRVGVQYFYLRTEYDLTETDEVESMHFIQLMLAKALRRIATGQATADANVDGGD